MWNGLYKHFVAQCLWNNCLPEATPLIFARYSRLKNNFRGLNFRVGLLTHEISEIKPLENFTLYGSIAEHVCLHVIAHACDHCLPL